MTFTYRLLPPDEWSKLADIFTEQKARLPHPCLAEITVAEDETGTIVGLLVKHLRCHVEPMWIAKEYRGKVHGRVDIIELGQHFTPTQPVPVYVFADSLARERQLSRAGFRKLDYTVFVKDDD